VIFDRSSKEQVEMTEDVPIPEALQKAFQLHQRGLTAQAEEIYRSILRVDPRNFDAQHLLGLVCHQTGRRDEAEQLLRAAVAVRPDSAEAQYNLGTALADAGKHDHAVDSYRTAVTLQPGRPENHYNLADALSELGRSDEAIVAYCEAVRLRPNYTKALLNIAREYRNQERHAEAIDCYQQILRYEPGSTRALSRMGATLVNLGRYDEAIDYYRRSIRLDPKDAITRRSLGSLLLLLGQFDEGWAEYEYRWQCDDMKLPAIPIPYWDGRPLGGRNIVIVGEQGLGDVLQFVRFAPILKEHGAAAVAVKCSSPAVKLLAAAAGIDEAIAVGTMRLHCDCFMPLMSIPRLLGTNLETIPANVPYLRVPADRATRWANEFAQLDGLKVGIAWQGNPEHVRDRQRSVPLTQFAPLAAVPGVSLVSLQKGHGSEQLATAPAAWQITDVGSRLTDLADAAAIVRQLDLVVTVDTALAHLAGGLGVPVWLALAALPDWRWLLHRDDSPWYPTARLFRQPTMGDWGRVFQRMGEELRGLVQSRTSCGNR
jgi:tetratricopeptide (TPR) repeat protein